VDASDLSGVSDQKLQFIVEHGDPSGQLYPLAQKVLASRVKPSVAMPLRPEQQAHIDRELATTAQPLPLPHHGVAQGIADAVNGLAGGVYSGVPGLAPALEAAGELSDTLVPGQDPRFNMLPRPGQIQQAMNESPQGPIVSSTLGAAVPLAGQTGLLGKTVQAGSAAALAPAAKVYQNLAGNAPGMARTVAAGSGTGTAIGAGEALIRRLPAIEQGLGQAVHGQPVTAQVPPVDVPNELMAPGAMGGISSLLPGISSWASNPNTIVGRRAQTFARDKASGAHQQEPLASLMEGQAGIEQAKELANRAYEDQYPVEAAPVKTQERRTIGAMERDTKGALGDLEMAKGQAAAEIEPKIRGKLQAQGKASGSDLQSTLNQLEQEGVTIPSEGFLDRVREIVAKSSRSDTANTPNEIRTPYGDQLAGIEAQAKRYLKEGGTVADWRNFLKYVKASAESGTAEKTFPFKEIVGAVREHMGAAEPRLAEATARYREATTGQERASGMMYRQDDLNALGKKAAHTKLDVPEAGDPFSPESLTPREETAGRQRLIQMGDKSASAAARSPEVEELRKRFPDEIGEMEQRLRDVDQLSYETQQAHDDAVAKVKAETQAKLVDISRELKPQTDAVLESKVAQEASKFRLGSLTNPLTLAALGATTHSPAHALSLEARAGENIGSRISQPIASAIAANTPDAADMRSTIPGMMGVATGASAPDAAKSMVEQARKQKERFKASILDRLEYNRPKAKNPKEKE
jgi:hypothetical protein